MAGKAPSGFHTSDRPDAAELGLCVHCGFCLNVCPTYLTLGIETDSPRGRIQLMRALDDGRVEASPRVLQHFDQCLQCRACETACPSGVPYGRLMEATRADLFARRPRSLRQRFFWSLIMRSLFLHPARLQLLGRALRAYQRSGLQRFVRAGGWLRGLAPGLATLEAQTPANTRAPFLPEDLKRYGPPEPPRARAALLLGCVMPILYGETHHATARVLNRNGVEVSAPAEQRCCGALHAHAGDLKTARDLARTNIDAFLADTPDAIVVNAAGCGSHMKEYAHLLRDDFAARDRAVQFTAIVRDVSEYLAEIGIDPPTGSVARPVTYQDSCHLAHAQKITEAPRALLRQIPGLELREMAHPDRCCGSAGLYALQQADLSSRVLADKMVEIDATCASHVCTANPGCMMQLDAGDRLFSGGDRPPTAHVIDLLDESYRIGEGEHYADKRA